MTCAPPVRGRPRTVGPQDLLWHRFVTGGWPAGGGWPPKRRATRPSRDREGADHRLVRVSRNRIPESQDEPRALARAAFRRHLRPASRGRLAPGTGNQTHGVARASSPCPSQSVAPVCNRWKASRGRLAPNSLIILRPVALDRPECPTASASRGRLAPKRTYRWCENPFSHPLPAGILSRIAALLRFRQGLNVEWRIGCIRWILALFAGFSHSPTRPP